MKKVQQHKNKPLINIKKRKIDRNGSLFIKIIQ